MTVSSAYRRVPPPMPPWRARAGLPGSHAEAFKRASCAEAAAAIQRAAARAMGRMELIITSRRPHGLCTENRRQETSWRDKQPAPQALQLLGAQVSQTLSSSNRPLTRTSECRPRPQDMVVSLTARSLLRVQVLL